MAAGRDCHLNLLFVGGIIIGPAPLILRSPTRQSRYGDGASEEMKNLTARVRQRAARCARNDRRLLISGEEPRRREDLLLRREKDLLEGRRVGDRSVEGADDSDGGVEVFQG